MLKPVDDSLLSPTPASVRTCTRRITMTFFLLVALIVNKFGCAYTEQTVDYPPSVTSEQWGSSSAELPSVHEERMMSVTAQWDSLRAERELKPTTTTHMPKESVKCRNQRGFYIKDIYEYDACAWCYHFMPDWAFHTDNPKFEYVSVGTLKDPLTNKTYLAETKNRSHLIFDTFLSKRYAENWVSCCKAAAKCCDEMTSTPVTVNDKKYCPRTWDGWNCWPDTPGGKTALAVCPDHVYFKSEPPNCARYAKKQCWKNGTWFINKYNTEWTNYSQCGIVKNLQNRLYFQVATFAVSIFVLIPAIIIFSVYKQLQVHRITMHKHLFLALLMNGIFVITFTSVVLMDESDKEESILKQNGAVCKMLLILKNYFRMTTYMWMLCEGFYLHKLIAAAFAEQKNLLMFYIIGWIFPLLPISIYGIIRKILADDNCWAIPEERYEWIMNTPNLLSLLLNLAFLCNIIRVLVTKLRAAHTNEPSQFRKAVRATLVLVPLFGLHFTLVIYRPDSGSCGWIEAYFYLSYAMDGLQGCLVALIFCYLNGEVQCLLKRSYHRFKLKRSLEGSTACHHNASRNPRISTTTQVTYITEGSRSNIACVNNGSAEFQMK
ncbi:calcitonin gene-related peptide type 1 receptor-like isoform X2 [Limulus polyphemus]|nr:calcitonin gene-related peptide type 1 receptor-like isoform X2 [Limulus polyphemus]XP_022237605.1 calcitonin gene-related peptide type 1 receptor-like isoform X2 [Limulus polyphemus]XP_022237606.1 calcitonin gene-related peptide type 1 receptor-like isoform X2 [Limulus polyphemus]XP_022237607.1 calcitonin gene-related peptide type 1 receptor-like isoform X2 [Limulus polyphemus]XP_022237608.1 calcitonin gene-related peptide type 1 receptor-like isoform X2 [Limulus polyphemus]XP_022237609.1 